MGKYIEKITVSLPPLLAHSPFMSNPSLKFSTPVKGPGGARGLLAGHQE